MRKLLTPLLLALALPVCALAQSVGGSIAVEQSSISPTSTQTITGATGTSPSWEVQITGDTNSRVAVGLNALDVGRLSFGPGNAARDTFLARVAAANFRFGSTDAATAVAQTLSVQNVVAGTSDTAGANLTIVGSLGTGTGAGGSIVFQTAAAGLTGSSQNPAANALTLAADKTATFTGPVRTTDGTLAAPAFAFSSETGTGFYRRASNIMSFNTSGTGRLEIAGAAVRVSSGGSFIWAANSTVSTAADTGLSRSSAGVVAAGNGTAGNAAGGMTMASLTATGASVIFSGLGSDAATTNNTLCSTTTTGVVTKGSGTAGICLGTSSARFKHDVRTELRGIGDLRPVEYKYDGGDERPLYGFIAEEVAQAMPQLVSYDAQGAPNSVDMLGVIPFLVNEIRALKAEIAELKAR